MRSFTAQTNVFPAPAGLKRKAVSSEIFQIVFPVLAGVEEIGAMR